MSWRGGKAHRPGDRFDETGYGLRPARPQPRGASDEAAAGQVFHHKERRGTLEAGQEDPHDPVVVQAGEEARLLLEALEQPVPAQQVRARPQDLHGHGEARIDVLGPVDDARGALADPLVDGVSRDRRTRGFGRERQGVRVGRPGGGEAIPLEEFLHHLPERDEQVQAGRTDRLGVGRFAPLAALLPLQEQIAEGRRVRIHGDTSGARSRFPQ
jgi:hypothetical protein